MTCQTQIVWSRRSERAWSRGSSPAKVQHRCTVCDIVKRFKWSHNKYSNTFFLVSICLSYHFVGQTSLKTSSLEETPGLFWTLGPSKLWHSAFRRSLCGQSLDFLFQWSILQRLELVEERLDEIGINPHESHPDPHKKSTRAECWSMVVGYCANLTKHHTCLFFRKRTNACQFELWNRNTSLSITFQYSANSNQGFLSCQHQTLDKTPEIQIETWRRCEFLD